MKKLRFATIAAATVALTASLTPSASAQDLNQIIDNFNCEALQLVVYNTGLAHENSTRSELAATLRDSTAVGQLEFPLNLAATGYSERIANRALTCGIVKEDPQDFLSQLQLFSSNLSSSFFTA